MKLTKVFATIFTGVLLTGTAIGQEYDDLYFSKKDRIKPKETTPLDLPTVANHHNFGNSGTEAPVTSSITKYANPDYNPELDKEGSNYEYYDENAIQNNNSNNYTQNQSRFNRQNSWRRNDWTRSYWYGSQICSPAYSWYDPTPRLSIWSGTRGSGWGFSTGRWVSPYTSRWNAWNDPFYDPFYDDPFYYNRWGNNGFYSSSYYYRPNVVTVARPTTVIINKETNPVRYNTSTNQKRLTQLGITEENYPNHLRKRVTSSNVINSYSNKSQSRSTSSNGYNNRSNNNYNSSEHRNNYYSGSRSNAGSNSYRSTGSRTSSSSGSYRRTTGRGRRGN